MFHVLMMHVSPLLDFRKVILLMLLINDPYYDLLELKQTPNILIFLNIIQILFTLLLIHILYYK
jgi:hypothetical protein